MAKQFISPKEITDRLGVSRSRAYQIAHECGFVRTGQRGIRVSEPAFQTWLRARTVAPKHPGWTVPKPVGWDPPMPPTQRRTSPRSGLDDPPSIRPTRERR